MMIRANRVIGLLLVLLATGPPGAMRIVSAADLLLKADTAAERQDIVWKSVGPGGGGWIQSITWDPTDADTLHVGGDVGGYYVSVDGGRHYRRKWGIHWRRRWVQS